MSADRFTFWDFVNWLIDQFDFPGYPSLRSKLPKIEATDGQEPTIESLREEARQADLQERALGLQKPSTSNLDRR